MCLSTCKYVRCTSYFGRYSYFINQMTDSCFFYSSFNIQSNYSRLTNIWVLCIWGAFCFVRYIRYTLYLWHVVTLKLPYLFAARLFWTFHNKLHNMKGLVILSHHDHHFSHLLVFMKTMNFCGSLWDLLEYFHEKKLPTAHCFNIPRGSYRD